MSGVIDAQQSAYRLTSLILWRELDRALVDALAPHGTILEAFAKGVSSQLSSFDEDAQEMAASEFCSLFVLPEGVSPRAASFMQGDVNTAGASISLAAKNAMQELALEKVADDFGFLPEDHVALLLSVAEAALAKGHVDIANALVEPWRKDFSERLLALNPSPLYKACANILLAL